MSDQVQDTPVAEVDPAAASVQTEGLLQTFDLAEADAEVQSVSCPDVIVPQAAGPWDIELYSPNCLKCDGFNPQADAQFGDDSYEMASSVCSRKAGNMMCPAGQIQVVFTGPRRKWVQKLTEARDSGDIAVLMEAMQAFTKAKVLSAEDRTFVLQETGIFNA